MTTKIGSVVVDVDARLTSLEANLAKASKRFDKFDKDMRRTGGQLEASFAKLGTAMTTMVAAFASTALAGGIAGLANTAKQIQNLSRLSGLGAVEFQSFAFAAKSVGFESDKVADILKDVNDKFGDFFQTGAGPLADFFEQIAPKVGVTAEQFRKLNSRDALQLYVESLEKANVSQADMTFYMEAIANDATALIPILKNGGKQLSEMEQEFKDLGLAIDDTTAKRLIEAQKSWDRGLTIMQNRATIFAGGVIEAFERIGETMDRNRANFVLNNPNASEAAQQWAQDVLIAQNRAGMDRLSALSRKFAPGDYLAEDDPWQPPDPKGKGSPKKIDDPWANFAVGDVDAYFDRMQESAERATATLESMGRPLSDIVAEIDAANAANLQPLIDSMQRAGERMEYMREQGVNAIGDALEDLAFEGGKNIDDLAKWFVRLAIRMELIEPLLDSLRAKSEALAAAGQGGGGILGTLFKLGSSLIGGGGGLDTSFASGLGDRVNEYTGRGFASGGRPPVGKWSLVGERGPELFQPDVAGRIIPNDVLQGIGGERTIRVDVTPSPYFDVRVTQISGQAVAQAVPAIVNASTRNTMDRANRRPLPRGLG